MTKIYFKEKKMARRWLLWQTSLMLLLLVGGYATLCITKQVHPIAWAASSGAASVSINPTQTTGTLPANYLGFSYEASLLASNPSGTSSFDSTKGNLVTLYKNLGIGNIRIGGNSVDRETFWQDNNQPVPSWGTAILKPTDIDRFAAFLQATNWKAELAVNLGHIDATSISSEA